MTTIYHLADAQAFAAAMEQGSYAGTVQDRADGFIHFSCANQVIESARRHRAGHEGLVLVAVAAESLGPELKWESARGGQLFPHLYGLLPRRAVLSVRPLPLGPDGLHVFPPLDP